jgi:hypothetical protein
MSSHIQHRFIPPSDEDVKNEGLTYDLSVHGTDGTEGPQLSHSLSYMSGGDRSLDCFLSEHTAWMGQRLRRNAGEAWYQKATRTCACSIFARNAVLALTAEYYIFSNADTATDLRLT